MVNIPFDKSLKNYKFNLNLIKIVKFVTIVIFLALLSFDVLAILLQYPAKLILKLTFFLGFFAIYVLYLNTRFSLPFKRFNGTSQENEQISPITLLEYCSYEVLELLYVLNFKGINAFLDKLFNNSDVKNIINRFDIDIQSLSSIIKQEAELQKIDVKNLTNCLIETAYKESIKVNDNSITTLELFLALFNCIKGIESKLSGLKLNLNEFRFAVNWFIFPRTYRYKHSPFNLNYDWKPVITLTSDWFTGFTYYLSFLSVDVIDFVRRHPGDYTIGHKDSLDKLLEILHKPMDPNAVLVGETGVGKTSIIYGLAQRIISGNVPDFLRHYRVLSIDFNKMLASLNKVGGLSTFIKLLEAELSLDVKVILFFDELKLLIDGNSFGGQLLSQLFPLFTKYNIPIVGTMSPAEYDFFKKNFSSLSSHFELINVPELSKEQTYKILLSKIYKLEKDYKVVVRFSALRRIIDLSIKYMPDKRLPKKAVNILEKAVSVASDTESKIVTSELIEDVVQNMTGIKVGVSKNDASWLLNLEDKIHTRYIDQEEAVHAIVEALKRNRLELSNMDKPIGVFLFLGPTGVGKTYLAKIVANEYFGENHQIIRVDMSQYKLKSDIYRIIATLKKVNLNPYSLILLDEFEKANPDIYDMFLRLFDEGVITTETGEKLYFTSSLIVATSNVGSQIFVKFIDDYDKALYLVKTVLPQFFKPELINRFDAIIGFKPLTKDHLKQITKLLLKDLSDELKLQGMKLLYDDNLASQIVEESFDPAMGARPIKRFIDQRVKGVIANYILQYKSQNGDNPSIIDLRKPV